MAAEIRIVEEAKKPLSMHPKKFAMWLFIVSVGMLFAAWTSAYIVKRGDPDWVELIIPQTFYANTIVIVLSSITLFWATIAVRKNNITSGKVAITLTTLLGLGFLIGQVASYQEMISLGQHLTGGSASHSFVYVIAGAHGLHLVGGVIYLLILMVSVFKGKVHSKSMTMMELCATYWHFLDVLWLYLFVFLILNR